MIKMSNLNPIFHLTKCSNCDKVFINAHPVKYCSYECRVEGIARINLARIRASHALDGSCDLMITHGKLRKRYCLICGEEFESRSVVRKYCSPKCKREGSARSKYVNRKLRAEEKLCQKESLSLPE